MEIAPKKVAVLGGGVMGTGIAALMANNGISVDIFDVKKEFAEKSIEKMADPKAKIPVLYSARRKKLVGAYELAADCARLAEADMIVEAVPEVLKIKQDTYAIVDAQRKKGSIICTNTSGLSINSMTDGRSEDFQRNFIGTHYFNPVRFMPLVEVIPAKTTAPELTAACMAWFSKLGKKPLIGFDTPNFIANRIGIFAFMKAMALMKKYGFDIETVDMITGTPIGAPKTGTFRLADMVGLDTLYHVAKNSFDACVNDEQRAVLAPPDFLERMMAEKKLGDKTEGGFYRKGKSSGGERSIEGLNLETWEYRPSPKPASDVVRVAKKFVSAEDRIKAMLSYGDDPVCSFARELVLGTAAYALNRVGEAAPDVATVDKALRWGFSRDVGPIEALDAIGLEKSASLMSELGIAVPKLLKEAIAGPGCFYQRKPGKVFSYCSTGKHLVEQPAKAGHIDIAALRESGKVLRETVNARMIDMGDGILLFELDSKFVPGMNPIDDFVMELMGQVFDVMAQGFRGLVIGNQSTNFSVGAQLMMIMELAKRKMWQDIEMASAGLQFLATSLRHAPFPVVTAPHNLTLGGGMEVTFAGHKVVAYAELYAGLVEAGVGLIPGGAGTLMLTRQLTDSMAARNPGPMPPVVKAFELIGMAQVSKSAEDACELGLLDKDRTVIVVDKDSQLARAKEECIKLAEGSFKPDPARKLLLPGPAGYEVLAQNVDGLLATGAISPHSAVIGKKLAWVLTGGDKASLARPIDEGEFLANERKAFLELCGMEKSQARMKHMLKTGKPLLN
jgi:3-hydroxyacyl-CoA dehydrogenase